MRLSFATAIALAPPLWSGAEHIRKPLEAERHRAGDQVRSVLRDVAIGHVGELGAGDLLEIHPAQMLRAADADRAVIELVGPLLGIGDQFVQRLHRQFRAGHDDDGKDRDERDRLEVLLGFVAEILVERLVDRGRARAGRHQGVAVGRGPGRRERAGIAAGARTVVDDEGLPERLARRDRAGSG